MRGRVGSISVGLCLLLTGCVPSEQMELLVSNPFGHGPDSQASTSMYAPAKEQELARRVFTVSAQVLKANAELNLHPMILPIGSDQPEIFHKGPQTIFITEGMISKCASDAQLAAVLCSELGKIVAEREAITLPETRQPDRRPPLDVSIGNDAATKFDTPDMTHLAELAKYEAQKKARDLPPLSPDVLTRRYVQKAGYKLDDLTAVQPLLTESENKGKLRKQMVDGVY